MREQDSKNSSIPEVPSDELEHVSGGDSWALPGGGSLYLPPGGRGNPWPDPSRYLPR